MNYFTFAKWVFTGAAFIGFFVGHDIGFFFFVAVAVAYDIAEKFKQ